MLSKLIGVLLVWIPTILTLSQAPPVGSWKSYVAYPESQLITGNDERIFCASMGGVYYFDQNTYEMNTLTRLDGLSDFDITCLKYVEEYNYLLIGYANGNFDIVTSDKVINIPVIKEKTIAADKAINSFYIVNENLFLCTSFSLIKFNLNKKEIVETYYLGPDNSYAPVYDITLFNDSLWLCSDQVIMKAAYNPSVNLLNLSNWQQMEIEFLGDGILKEIESSDNALFALFKDNNNIDDVILKYEDYAWDSLEFTQVRTNQLVYKSNKLYTISWGGLITHDLETGEHTEKTIGGRLKDLVVTNNEIWCSATGYGVVNSNTPYKYIYPDGPANSIFWELHFNHNRLYATRGYIDATYTSQWTNAEIYIYHEGDWQNIENKNARDYCSIVSDPVDPEHFFVGAWGYGLHEYKNGELVQTYDQTNNDQHTLSAINGMEGSPSMRIGGIQYDLDGNLWIVNSLVSKSNTISVLKNDGTWKAFDYGGYMNAHDIDDLYINHVNGDKWVILPRGNGIFIFNNGADIENEEDDLYSRFDLVADGENLSNVTCIEKDMNGHMWIGTNQGPIVYYRTNNALEDRDGVLECDRILIPRNEGYGLADYLLADQAVTTIKVDGGNRKWIGTRSSGAYLVTASGEEIIHHFTVNNSPLSSNYITDIAIDPQTGEVFFGTFQGLVSFGGSSTTSKEVYYSAEVYPNPVRESYYGDIIIRGLLEDTYIKITDVSGRLVHESVSEGGTAIWSGKNLSGQRVSTGVYLVFGSTELGEESMVAKILFIR